MKCVRWILWFLLFAGGLMGFIQPPFFKKLPMLLFPEQSWNFVCEKTIRNIYDEILDPQPICIQTQNNFSYFSNDKDFEKNDILLYLKSNLLQNSTTLFSEKIIEAPQKSFSPESTPVWVIKHVTPMRITEEAQTTCVF